MRRIPPPSHLCVAVLQIPLLLHTTNFKLASYTLKMPCLVLSVNDCTEKYFAHLQRETGVSEGDKSCQETPAHFNLQKIHSLIVGNVSVLDHLQASGVTS